MDVNCWRLTLYHHSSVKIFLDVDHPEYTPLHNAAWGGHKDVVELLIDRGADPNIANKYGQTPLHGAVSKGHKDVVQLLLDRGADPHNINVAGETPHTIALNQGHTDIAHIIQGSGA